MLLLPDTWSDSKATWKVKPCGFYMLCCDFLKRQDCAGLSWVDQKKSLKAWLPRDVSQSLVWFILKKCFCVKHKKIGGTSWPLDLDWLIFQGRAGAMKDRNVPKPMEKKNLENQFKSLQLRRDLEMERTAIESSSHRVVVFGFRNKMTEWPSPLGCSEASTSGKSFTGGWKSSAIGCYFLDCMWYHENILNILSHGGGTSLATLAKRFTASETPVLESFQTKCPHNFAKTGSYTANVSTCQPWRRSPFRRSAWNPPRWGWESLGFVEVFENWLLKIILRISWMRMMMMMMMDINGDL